jgi:hypothetical protein
MKLSDKEITASHYYKKPVWMRLHHHIPQFKVTAMPSRPKLIPGQYLCP